MHKKTPTHTQDPHKVREPLVYVPVNRISGEVAALLAAVVLSSLRSICIKEVMKMRALMSAVLQSKDPA
jgi:hypothetical protein